MIPPGKGGCSPAHPGMLRSSPTFPGGGRSSIPHLQHLFPQNFPNHTSLPSTGMNSPMIWGRESPTKEHRNPPATLPLQEKPLCKGSCSASSLISSANEQPGGVKGENEPVAVSPSSFALPSVPVGWMGDGGSHSSPPKTRRGATSAPFGAGKAKQTGKGGQDRTSKALSAASGRAQAAKTFPKGNQRAGGFLTPLHLLQLGKANVGDAGRHEPVQALPKPHFALNAPLILPKRVRPRARDREGNHRVSPMLSPMVEAGYFSPGMPRDDQGWLHPSATSPAKAALLSPTSTICWRGEQLNQRAWGNHWPNQTHLGPLCKCPKNSPPCPRAPPAALSPPEHPTSLLTRRPFI